jgi:cell division protein FtsI (penicillin-binding protein 3)
MSSRNTVGAWSGVLGMGTTRVDRVSRIVAGVMTLALVGTMARVVQLQLAPSERLSEHIQERVTRRSVPAGRGDIMDRRGRYLATTQFGYRVFVDPLEFPNPPDEAILQLAETIGLPPGEVGKAIIEPMAKNQRRIAERPALLPSEQQGGPLSRLIPLVRMERGEARRAEPAGAVLAMQGEGDDGEVVDGEAVEGESRPRPLIRYARVSQVLDDETVQAVRSLRIRGVHLEQRPVREYPGGELAASIVGKVGIDHNGLLGAELSHEPLLSGTSGRMLYVRDARGRPLWMGPRSYEPPVRGKNVRLSLDMELQRIAVEELTRGMHDANAAGARIVVMDPASGEILAMADLVREVPDAVPFPWPDALPRGMRSAARPSSGLLHDPQPVARWQRYITINPDPLRDVHPALGRNRCVEDIYEPGSTFKIFVWAAITDLGLARPDEMFDTEGGIWRTIYGRTIRDVIRRSTMRWDEVLINSSNIGMVKAAERMSFDQLHAAVRRFGFGSRTNIGLPGETAGLVTNRRNWGKYTQTSVSFGNEVAVTPVQMARAFSAIARGGEGAGTLPPVSLVAIDADDASRSVMHRIVKPETAVLTRQVLRPVAEKVEQRMATDKNSPERGWRYTMFGKSGTAQIPLGRPPEGKRRPHKVGYFDEQYNSSFIAGGPLEDPRLVVLVVIDDPGPERRRNKTHYGSHVAGPVVRRVLERSLSYLNMPPSPVTKASGVTMEGE